MALVQVALQVAQAGQGTHFHGPNSGGAAQQRHFATSFSGNAAQAHQPVRQLLRVVPLQYVPATMKGQAGATDSILAQSRRPPVEVTPRSRDSERVGATDCKIAFFTSAAVASG